MRYSEFLDSQPFRHSTEHQRKSISGKYNGVKNGIRNIDPLAPMDVFNMPLDVEETESAINAFKQHKASESTQIPSEALQQGGQALTSALHKVFCSWFDLGITPDEMQTAMVIPLFKKGDVTNTANYRPISLLNSIFKTYEKILERRLRAFIEGNNLLTPLQMGARAKTGATEAIFQLLTATQYNMSNNNPLFLTLLDLSKAYDRVWRDGLWVKLHSLGIQGQLLRALHSTYSNPTFTVKIGDCQSESSQCTNGLRQGSVLSSTLCNPFLGCD